MENVVRIVMRMDRMRIMGVLCRDLSVIEPHSKMRGAGDREGGVCFTLNQARYSF